MRTNYVGNRYYWYSWDTTPSNGYYYTYEGANGCAKQVKRFKTLAGAKRWCIRMAGTDKFEE